MESRVKEILSWYSSDSPGTRTNIARLLNHGRLAGTGKLVILPVDQGFEHGPARSFAVNPAGYDPSYHFQLAIDAGCNALPALKFSNSPIGQHPRLTKRLFQSSPMGLRNC
jgi:class I fructose-bisphosphate aldolase